jgi:hypothetical protein
MGPRSMETDLKNHSTHSLHRALKNRRETKMGKWHRCINHLWALLLVEIGGAGVEHHGLDGEVPGVLLPVALLRHPLLDLHLPCNTHNHHTREQRTHVPGTCPKWNNNRETQRADLIHSVGDQRAVSPASYHWWNQQRRRRRPSGQVRAFVPLNQVRTRGEMFWGDGCKV